MCLNGGPVYTDSACAPQGHWFKLLLSYCQIHVTVWSSSQKILPMSVWFFPPSCISYAKLLLGVEYACDGLVSYPVQIPGSFPVFPGLDSDLLQPLPDKAVAKD